ncbi:HAD family hydrolase [Marinomonas pollencensis]|uniref:Phosphoglycolate phosphatase n=1 Tax=Marinomonas pollencensis TaxID=491954 RepID=A0A3E0DRS8_9GAMM|nr:HAD-IA family hydrolase [Marinomonas pollencensis]REG85714.1 phosphoglycolate phosphatase [Marinomonas pollencensis]
MVKLVIFDWDGTLYDSIAGICNSMLEAGVRAGAPKREYDDIKNIIGLSLDTAIETVWPELDDAHRAELTEHYKHIYVSQDQTPPNAYEGVLELLTSLQASGIQLAVATGKSRRGLNRVMGLTNTEGFFVTSRCADEAVSKPHPLMLEQILAELNLSPDEAIMIGDTEYDLKMAANAGMRSVGVTYGAHHQDRLKACNPHAIISDIRQLTSILGLTTP